jgi:hypothetical protein
MEPVKHASSKPPTNIVARMMSMVTGMMSGVNLAISTVCLLLAATCAPYTYEGLTTPSNDYAEIYSWFLLLPGLLVLLGMALAFGTAGGLGVAGASLGIAAERSGAARTALQLGKYILWTLATVNLLVAACMLVLSLLGFYVGVSVRMEFFYSLFPDLSGPVESMIIFGPMYGLIVAVAVGVEAAILFVAAGVWDARRWVAPNRGPVENEPTPALQ